ncbi:unnamed protein product [Penicillium roqueforti FM164]|uniref:Genomic scaffold, ProqFM164S01 n=1 Tax=Penicillium roqueforti (strain FM164) TaxID=1365484 RepID=W6PW94_PENRF|nr:unnamed protein product [Penicillium roqueforti FM164]
MVLGICTEIIMPGGSQSARAHELAPGSRRGSRRCGRRIWRSSLILPTVLPFFISSAALFFIYLLHDEGCTAAAED